MKKTCFYIFRLVYWLIQFSEPLLQKNKSFLNYKLKLGLVLLALKTFPAQSQHTLQRGTCYRAGPRYRRAIETKVTDRLSLKEGKDNSVAFHAGIRRSWMGAGVTLKYNFFSSSVDAGPYIRLFPIENRRNFLLYIELNNQFPVSNKITNELNISGGIIFHHDYRFCFTIGYQFTHATGEIDENYFRPIVGVHYQIRHRLWWRGKRKDL